MLSIFLLCFTDIERSIVVNIWLESLRTHFQSEKVQSWSIIEVTYPDCLHKFALFESCGYAKGNH